MKFIWNNYKKGVAWLLGISVVYKAMRTILYNIFESEFLWLTSFWAKYEERKMVNWANCESFVKSEIILLHLDSCTTRNITVWYQLVHSSIVGIMVYTSLFGYHGNHKIDFLTSTGRGGYTLFFRIYEVEMEMQMEFRCKRKRKSSTSQKTKTEDVQGNVEATRRRNFPGVASGNRGIV